MNNFYEKEYEIAYWNTNSRLESNITSILHFFSDIAIKQEESLGFSMGDMLESREAWVLFDYDINIIRYPKYRDKIRVRTFVETIRRFYGLRGFEIYSEDGELLVKCDSIWFLIDLEKRRLKSADDKYYIAHKLDKGNLKNLRSKLHIDELDKIDINKIYNIEHTHIDSNKHVNNVKYMEWVIDSMPLEIIENYKINRLKVKFEKEVQYGHNVLVQGELKKIDDNIVKSIHIIKSDSGEKLTSVESFWFKIN